MDSLYPKFVFPAPDRVWRPDIESGAGIYLMGAELHFVAPGSPREAEVVEAGALRVGTLRFDADPLERTHPWHPVRVVDPRAVAGRDPNRN